MVKKIIISLTIAASMTAIVTLVNTGQSVKYVAGDPNPPRCVNFGCNDNASYYYVVSYKGFPIYDGQYGQIVFPDESWSNNNNSYTYSVLGIIENSLIWFLITFGLIEGYSFMRKSISVGENDQSIKK